MKNMLWAAGFGYLVYIITGFNVYDWQWWALFGGATLGVIINSLD